MMLTYMKTATATSTAAKTHFLFMQYPLPEAGWPDSVRQHVAATVRLRALFRPFARNARRGIAARRGETTCD